MPGVKGRDAAKKAIEGLHSREEIFHVGIKLRAVFSEFEFHPVGPLIAESLPEGTSST